MKIQLIFLVFLIACLSCNGPQNKDSNLVDSATNSTASLAVTDTSNVSESDARGMAHLFRQKTGYYRNLTSCWLKKDLINNLYIILSRPSNKLDGIRIYLGMKKGHHTFLIVPTRENGSYIPDTCGTVPAKPVKAHDDIFGFNLPGFRHPVHNGRDDVKDGGATLGDVNGCPLGHAVFFGAREHEIPCQTARTWVNNRVMGTPRLSDTVNTYSEWFETNFIKKLNEEVNASRTHIKDGIRIYLARQDTMQCGLYRHVFLFVATYAAPASAGPRKKHIDDYTPFDKALVQDNGEQCLNNCKGTKLN